MPTYRIFETSLQERFHASKAKIQLFAGGFANGKTSAGCIKAIEWAKAYPGSNGLIARSTYPKLNDTIRKEFVKWCPQDWIKSFPMSANASNTCTLTNGTTVNFRYIQQQGKSANDATTSNLLSATYDWIVVDQIEDPEIVHKDLLDLLGRLRGMAPYDGDDPDMPATGPRMVIITCNPTRGWVYKQLVKPLQDLEHGILNPNLMCETDASGNPKMDDDGNPTPMIELFEGSTYENADNLEEDYIRTLEASYRGQMRARFLMGQWAAYEGLVYPQFDESVHTITRHAALAYMNRLQMDVHELSFIEGFDHGIAVPSCYLCGFVDTFGNVIIVDGFYAPELSPSTITERIQDIRRQYNVPDNHHVLADPDIFRRKGSSKSVVGATVAELLHDKGRGVYCSRGNNAVHNGIVKVSGYLEPMRHHQHPITGTFNAPHYYVVDDIEFLIDEFNGYYWKHNPQGELIDMPVDKDDHAMDTTKYMLSKQPEVPTLVYVPRDEPVGWFKWAEVDHPSDDRRRRLRHGRNL